MEKPFTVLVLNSCVLYMCDDYFTVWFVLFPAGGVLRSRDVLAYLKVELRRSESYQKIKLMVVGKAVSRISCVLCACVSLHFH